MDLGFRIEKGSKERRTEYGLSGACVELLFRTGVR